MHLIRCSETFPTEDYLSNVLPLQILLDVASKNDKKPFIYKKYNNEELNRTNFFSWILKTNIQKVSDDVWEATGLNKNKLTTTLNKLGKDWNQDIFEAHITEWTKANPKWTKILEGRAGCLSSGGRVGLAAGTGPSECLKNKIRNPLPKNFETAKSEPKGKPNIHENKSEKKEIFKDNKIISNKSRFNEKIRLKEFLNISVNSII